MSGETKEPTTTTTPKDAHTDGGGEKGELVIKSTPSLASRLNQRADLLRRILSFHKTKNPKHYYDLRSFSKLFHRALPQPPPLWTSFPNSNHTTLQSLLDRLRELWQGGDRSTMPFVIFIGEGEHSGICTLGEERKDYVKVQIPLSIYGAGRGRTTLVGVGLWIQGNKSFPAMGVVEIGDLTIKGGKRHGLTAYRGMDVRMRGVTVENCQCHGVGANGADISCDDLQVVGCGLSGVCASSNATITLSGQGTTIQGNVTDGDSDLYDYGLYTDSSSGKIQLVLPLTKEQISTNNGGGGNWGGDGTIEQVSRIFTFAEKEAARAAAAAR